MQDRLNKVFKMHSLTSYASITFYVDCGGKMKSYTIKSNTKITAEACYLPTIPSSFTMIMEYIEDPFKITHIDTIISDSLLKLFKHVDPFDPKNLSLIIVTGWDDTKIVYMGKDIITLKPRNSSTYQAVQINDDLVMSYREVYNSTELSPVDYTMVISYFPSLYISILTKDDHILVDVKELEAKSKDFINSFDWMGWYRDYDQNKQEN